MSGDTKVVVVHDYVTQRGGAERVTIDLLRAFGASRLVTSIWNEPASFPEFNGFNIETSRLNRYTAFRTDPRRAFPLLARAFERQVIADADVVICSSSGWSHRIKTLAPKIVYCHNPARWLYQPDDYFAGLPAWSRQRFAAMTDQMRRTDALAAASATRYVANSSSVAARVATAYGIQAEIVHPPRGLSPHGPREAVPGIEPGFLLTIGRRRGYKNTEAVIGAVASMPGERLVAVGAGAIATPPGVTALSGLSDAALRWLLDNAAGLVAVAQEDFGLTVVEAQAFGVPTVVLRAGGYLDTGVDGVTAVFVDDGSQQSIASGIRELRSRTWNADAIRTMGERYSFEAFSSQMHRVVDEVLERQRVVGRANSTRLSTLPQQVQRLSRMSA